jgi:hypothetical protein
MPMILHIVCSKCKWIIGNFGETEAFIEKDGTLSTFGHPGECFAFMGRMNDEFGKGNWTKEDLDKRLTYVKWTICLDCGNSFNLPEKINIKKENCKKCNSSNLIFYDCLPMYYSEKCSCSGKKHICPKCKKGEIFVVPFMMS